MSREERADKKRPKKFLKKIKKCLTRKTKTDILNTEKRKGNKNMVAIFKNEFNHPFIAVAETEADAREYIKQNFSTFIVDRWYAPRNDAFIIKSVEIWKSNPTDTRKYWNR